MARSEDSNNYLCGIDIGSNVIRCVIMSRPDQPGDLPQIVGYGEACSAGVRKGAVIDHIGAAQAIDAALAAAEKMSGTRVDAAIFSVNGDHVSTLSTKGVVAIPPNSEISYEDTQKAIDAAAIMQLPPNQEIVDLIATNYSIDGQEAVKDPTGMSGSRLELHGLAVINSSYALKAVRKAIEVANLECITIQPAIRAAAEAVLSSTQRERGAVVVDIGAQTTGIAVFEEAELTKLAVVAMGSSSITNDLAIGLRVDFDLAEQIKSSHAQISSSNHQDGTVQLEYGDETLKFRNKDINLIVTSRLEEILEKVAKELKKMGQHSRLPGGVVFCGQGSTLPGLLSVAKSTLNLPVQVAKLTSYQTSTGDTLGVDWATSIGLVLLEAQAMSEGSARHTSVNPRQYLDRLVKRFLKK